MNWNAEQHDKNRLSRSLAALAIDQLLMFHGSGGNAIVDGENDNVLTPSTSIVPQIAVIICSRRRAVHQTLEKPRNSSTASKTSSRVASIGSMPPLGVFN